MSFPLIGPGLHETFKDHWQRYLAACAVGYALLPERPGAAVTLQIWRNEAYHQTGLDESPIAAALGIAVRKRVEWREHDNGGTTKQSLYLAQDREFVTFQSPDGTWTASQTDSKYNELLRVTGHPTPQSAQEHIERLYGRTA